MKALMVKALERVVAAMKRLTNEALWIDNQMLILYNPKVDLESYDMEIIEKAIYGAMLVRYNESYEVHEVSSVRSEKGYGPLVYLLAMQEFGGLTPIRTREITPAAKKVWKEFYDGAGKNLVETKDIGLEHYDEDYLNLVYYIQKLINIHAATKRHDKAIGKDPYQEKSNLLLETADSYVANEMRRIYPPR